MPASYPLDENPYQSPQDASGRSPWKTAGRVVLCLVAMYVLLTAYGEYARWKRDSSKPNTRTILK